MASSPLSETSPKWHHALARSALLIGVCAMVLAFLMIATVILATAVWRAHLPDPALTPGRADEAFVVVFFDHDVETTLPRAQAGLTAAEELGIKTVFFVGGARAWRDHYGSVELAERLGAQADQTGIRLIADRQSYDTITNLEQVLAFRNQRFPDATAVMVSDDYHLMRIDWLIGGGSIPVEHVAFVAAGEPRSALDHIYRSIWEVGAWLSLAVPHSLREYMLAHTRR